VVKYVGHKKKNATAAAADYDYDIGNNHNNNNNIVISCYNPTIVFPHLSGIVSTSKESFFHACLSASILQDLTFRRQTTLSLQPKLKC
jgi:hypothetical protein